MARLRRVVVATRKLAIRYTETNTRAKCRQFMDEMLTDDMVKRGFKISASRKVYDDLDCEIYYYTYDITALI